MGPGVLVKSKGETGERGLGSLGQRCEIISRREIDRGNQIIVFTNLKWVHPTWLYFSSHFEQQPQIRQRVRFVQHLSTQR